MAEEEQNQLEISLNRISLEDIREDENEDRISSLPDSLLVEILSRLDKTKYAFRTGMLSKRWEHVWTLLLDLSFVHFDHPSADFTSFVDKTLTQRGEYKLKSFKLACVCRYSHESEFHQFENQLHKWIRYAINCNVEDFDLGLCFIKCQIVFQLDQCFFINSCFTKLSLYSCQFKPSGAISWKNLRTLSITHAELDEDMIENILSGSPVLETLKLYNCNGYRQLNITSKSVKTLELYGYKEYSGVDVVEINAPYILSLKVQDELYLWKVLLINVSSLVKADLYYWKRGYFETTAKEAEEEMLKGFILNLRHVKELIIGPCYLKVLSRLKAKGFSLPSNLKIIDYNPEIRELIRKLGGDESDSDSATDGPDENDLDEGNDEEVVFLDDGPADAEVI